jgi:hypothetical protein
LLGHSLRRTPVRLDPPAVGTPPRVPIRYGWVTPPCISALVSSLSENEFFSILRLLALPVTWMRRTGAQAPGRSGSSEKEVSRAFKSAKSFASRAAIAASALPGG